MFPDLETATRWCCGLKCLLCNQEVLSLDSAPHKLLGLHMPVTISGRSRDRTSGGLLASSLAEKTKEKTHKPQVQGETVPHRWEVIEDTRCPFLVSVS